MESNLRYKPKQQEPEPRPEQQQQQQQQQQWELEETWFGHSHTNTFSTQLILANCFAIFQTFHFYLYVWPIQNLIQFPFLDNNPHTHMYIGHDSLPFSLFLPINQLENKVKRARDNYNWPITSSRICGSNQCNHVWSLSSLLFACLSLSQSISKWLHLF